MLASPLHISAMGLAESIVLTFISDQVDWHAVGGLLGRGSKGGVDQARGGGLAEAGLVAEEVGVVPVEEAIYDGEGRGDAACERDAEHGVGDTGVRSDVLAVAGKLAFDHLEAHGLTARGRIDCTLPTHEAARGNALALVDTARVVHTSAGRVDAKKDKFVGDVINAWGPGIANIATLARSTLCLWRIGPGTGPGSCPSPIVSTPVTSVSIVCSTRSAATCACAGA
jgi:hypothetical protein